MAGGNRASILRHNSTALSIASPERVFPLGRWPAFETRKSPAKEHRGRQIDDSLASFFHHENKIASSLYVRLEVFRQLYARDRRIKLRPMLHQLTLFLWLILTKWQGYVTGGVLVAILTVIERKTGKQLPWAVFKWVFVVSSYWSLSSWCGETSTRVLRGVETE